MISSFVHHVALLPRFHFSFSIYLPLFRQLFRQSLCVCVIYGNACKRWSIILVIVVIG